MRIVKFLLRTFLVFFVFFIIAATIYVRIYGKSLVEGVLNASLKRNVVLGTASYHFPFGFQARDVHIAQSLEGGEFLDIERIIAQLSPDDAIFKGRLAFDIVILMEPSLEIEGKKDLQEIESAQKSEGAKTPQSVQMPSSPAEVGFIKIKKTEISITKLIVKQGRLKYRDGLTEKGFSFDLENIQLEAWKLAFPLKPEKSKFKVAANLVKKGNPLSGSHVNGSGWIDAVSRDMEATMEVVEANGAVGLTADAVSRNNDMNVTGQIKMQNLIWGIDEKVSSDASAINDLILNALSSSGIEIGAKFSFRTKMDNFQIEQVSFTGNVVTK